MFLSHHLYQIPEVIGITANIHDSGFDETRFENVIA